MRVWRLLRTFSFSLCREFMQSAVVWERGVCSGRGDTPEEYSSVRSHYERSLTSVRQLLLYTYLITSALIFRVVFTLFRLPCRTPTRQPNTPKRVLRAK